MQAFVYRLVERLTNDAPALSRNRHFHTFATPEGQQALRIARRLHSLASDIAAASSPPSIDDPSSPSGRVRVEIPILAGKRVATLPYAEWELLRRMPAMRRFLSN